MAGEPGYGQWTGGYYTAPPNAASAPLGYNGFRTHLFLEMDNPSCARFRRETKAKLYSSPKSGGLHHRYERRAA
jgi:hypothetical protein